MRQILLLIVLFFASSWVARKIRQAQARGDGPFAGGTGRTADSAPGTGGAAHAGRARDAALPEPMVRCTECGVHAPKSDAIAAGGEYFCSPEHAARHAAHSGSRSEQ
ncbi:MULTISPECIES: PP0621 family protein [unclassified Burkholderia]|uniref:PP0621 family protein n=1 Tax=unclassified Burkholderia TaxID=2613784 RepID=UPI00075C9FAD|nr:MULTISPECIES: PP0621 family protein [unclassified Burkholderia]KVN14394.1 deaminase [Burkholderia sp. MSMB1552]KWZ57017.1 deaminase [Burkholderia sp. MSMB1588]